MLYNHGLKDFYKLTNYYYKYTLGGLMMKENTLVILKPDCLERNLVEKCVSRLIEIGKIERIKYHIVKTEEILKHYQENLINQPNEIKNRVLDYFVNKAVIIITLSGIDIIKRVRDLIGASDPSKAKKNSIRGEFCNDSYELAESENRSCRNIIHASDSKISYKYEYDIWFSKRDL